MLTLLKKIIVVVLLSSACTSEGIQATTGQELFFHANSEYDQKEFEQALKSYQSITPKSASIWYNMGNCSYKLNDYIQALVYWKRSQKGSSGKLYKQANRNRDALYAKVDINNEETTLQSWVQTIKGCAAYFPVGMLQGFFLLCLVCIIFGYKYSKHSLRRKIALVLLIIMNGMSGGLLIIKYYDSITQSAVVAEQTLSLFAGPDEHYHVMGSVSQLACVSILEEQDSWYKIKYQQLIGWVPKDKLVVI